jgi:enoyl-CoA hydratase
MTYAQLDYEKKGHVVYITLNRPQINLQIAQELTDACKQVNQDDEVYVVVITGTGNVFCRGSESDQLSESGEPARESIDIPAFGHQMHTVARAVASINRPVIAAINGDAIGQGFELALSCDIRICSPGTHFGLPQVALGRIPMDGGTQRLPRIVGKAKALELILTSETIGAEEALAMGLVSKIISAEELMSEVSGLAEAMTKKAPIALRYAKETVNQGMDLTLEQGLRLEADLYAIVSTTEDKVEGVTTYLQKKPPNFKNK